MATELLITGPNHGARTIILAHGAGVGMESPFMAYFADGLGRLGYRVVRFQFPYMVKQVESGRRRPPDREPLLRQAWYSAIEAAGADRPIIGGKSMGGRIASLIADEADAGGLVCLGYPFHPPKRLDRLRTQHLTNLRTPTLICQGCRDPFGTIGEVSEYQLSSAVGIHWLPDGDHSLKPRRRSGRDAEQNWDEAIEHIADFVADLDH